jgi:hypothetical protein
MPMAGVPEITAVNEFNCEARERFGGCMFCF